MVLTELGNKLTSALRELSKKRTIDDDALKAVLKQVCGALLESDVNVGVVATMRRNVMSRVDLENTSRGTDKGRLIKKAVFDELVRLGARAKWRARAARGAHGRPSGWGAVVAVRGTHGSRAARAQLPACAVHRWTCLTPRSPRTSQPRGVATL